MAHFFGSVGSTEISQEKESEKKREAELEEEIRKQP